MLIYSSWRDYARGAQSDRGGQDCVRADLADRERYQRSYQSDGKSLVSGQWEKRTTGRVSRTSQLSVSLTRVSVKQLGTAINGAVDSPVNGGVKLYRNVR